MSGSRFRASYRATILAVAALLPPFATAQAAYKLDIPAQELGDALRAVGRQTNTNVIFEPSIVRGLNAGSIRAEKTADQAIQELLAGTRLTARRTSTDTVVVQREQEPPSTFAPDGASTATSEESSATGSETSKASKEAQSRSFWDRFRVAQADQGQAPNSRSLGAENRPSVATLEEIIVTAQKRTERLQDVPVPVTAISADTLVNSNQLRLQDYYSKVPGLNFSMDNRGAPTMSIRGITTGAFVTPTIGFTVDDVPYGSSVALSPFSPAPDIDPNELAHIEVLRGPQGTLYGASSLGGLIKYVTIDPSTEAVSGRVQVGTNAIRHGNGEGYSASGAINVPLSDTAAIRASAFSRQDPGYIDNIRTGKEDVNEIQVDGARLSTLWRISDAFTLRLNALLQRSEADGASQVQPGLDEWEQQWLGDVGGHERTVQAYSANLAGRIGKAELTSITGFNAGRSEDSFDVSSGLGPFTELFYGVGGVAWIDADNETRNFSQEFRLAMPLSDRIDWFIGAFYTDQRTDTDGGFVLVDPATFARGLQVSRQRIDSTYEEYALFTDFTLHVTDRFDVQVGGRGGRNEQTSANVTTGVPPLFGDSVQPETESTDNVFTYLVTPRLKLSPDLMVYARFASGYRPGGPNGVAEGIPRTFDADRTQNYELGIKGAFLDARLSVDASAYYISWRDIQITQLQPDPPFAGYTDNGSRARSRGVELSIEARPADGTSVSLWTAWNDSELTEDLPATSTFPGSAGDRLPYSTRLSGALSLEQTFPLGSWTGLLGGSASYVGEREGEFTAPRQIYPSYTRVDLRAGMHAGSWRVNLFVNNVADERGVLSGGAGIFPFSFTYIQPRTVGLWVAKTFE